ncbi:hypothetical protein PghCCS26_28720 [Paenibacillus glycanilyticus]|uniref:Cyclic pyranopterin monophosphate synthase n=1 Tax=Paenibacillus glycanilyticus TaxID=126569 RepID=A0ABQ6NLV7_9BACL|nr:hypothetical protein [Paenibacillus glycanilyticus]GMK45744.1 hypothetical protein PghCCS26_28720 [Paenibacillus glycanilyticus]
MRETGPKWATRGSLTIRDIVKAGEEAMLVSLTMRHIVKERENV